MGIDGFDPKDFFPTSTGNNYDSEGELVRKLAEAKAQVDAKASEGYSFGETENSGKWHKVLLNDQPTGVYYVESTGKWITSNPNGNPREGDLKNLDEALKWAQDVEKTA